MSVDGRTALADGRSQWITGAAARADVQQWRARSSAILTASGTVGADDPRLTVRDLPPHAGTAPFTPLRVVLDRCLRTSPGAALLDGAAPTLVVHEPAAQPSDARFDRVERIAIAAPDGRLDLGAVLALLAGRGCNEVQVEAGPTLCGSLMAAGLVDELLVYVAPVLLGDAGRPLLRLPGPADVAGATRLREVDRRAVGNDLRLLYRCAPE
jgi:diaminohydroxyphosphoribosylaminopyrimidine deaminase/5-amino-6-(5-phosphoribosylamino)uracil reductase